MRKAMLWMLVLAAGLCWSSPAAQEDEGDAERFRKQYSLQGLRVHTEPHRWLLERPAPRLIQVKAAIRWGGPQIFYPGLYWHSKQDSAVGAPLQPAEMIEQIAEVTHPYSYANPIVSGGLVSIEGSQKEHDRFAWALECLKAYYSRTIQFSVVELKQDAPSGPVSAARATELRKGARALATRRVLPTELALVSAVTTLDYTCDYEVNVATSAAIFSPQMRRLYIGSELGLSAVPAPDGALLVRGVRAETRLREMKKFDGHKPCGVFEQPDWDLDLEESGVLLNAGESWVFGKYLVTARLEKEGKQGLSPDKTFALLAPDLLMPRHNKQVGATPGSYRVEVQTGTAGNWTESETPSGPTANREAFIDCFGEDGALASDEYVKLEEKAHDTFQFGPLVGFTWTDEIKPPEAVEPAAPGVATLQVRRWHLSRDAAIPDDLLGVKPATASLDRLGAPVYSRRFSQLEHGLIEDYRVRLTNFVSGFNSSTATGIAVYDPVVDTMVSGTRLTIEVGAVADDGADLDVLFALAPDGTIAPSKAEIPVHGHVQTATIASTGLHMVGSLKVGESMVEITPMPDQPEQLIVLAITRVER